MAAAAQWLAHFAISSTFPAMADLSLVFAYGFYTLMTLGSLSVVIRFVPETRHKELEDME